MKNITVILLSFSMFCIPPKSVNSGKYRDYFYHTKLVRSNVNPEPFQLYKPQAYKPQYYEFRSEEYDAIDKFCKKNGMQFNDAAKSVQVYSKEICDRIYKDENLNIIGDTIGIAFLYTSKFKTLCINIEDVLMKDRISFIDSLNWNILKQWDFEEPKSQYSLIVNARLSKDYKLRIDNINYGSLYPVYISLDSCRWIMPIMVYKAQNGLLEQLAKINICYNDKNIEINGDIKLNCIINQYGQIIYLRILSSSIKKDEYLKDIFKNILENKIEIECSRYCAINFMVSYKFY